MNTLICGSIAYDSIMVFHGRFKDHILPDQVHILNVSFLVPTLRREYGGVAGNIAYNLALLRAIPRTASVIAYTDATVYELNRDLFLTAVVGHAATQRRADDIADTRLATGVAPDGDGAAGTAAAEQC